MHFGDPESQRLSDERQLANEGTPMTTSNA